MDRPISPLLKTAESSSVSKSLTPETWQFSGFVSCSLTESDLIRALRHPKVRLIPGFTALYVRGDNKGAVIMQLLSLFFPFWDEDKTCLTQDTSCWGRQVWIIHGFLSSSEIHSFIISNFCSKLRSEEVTVSNFCFWAETHRLLESNYSGDFIK